MYLTRILRLPLLAFFIVVSQASYADARATLDSILKMDEEPAGVVFEIVTGGANSLKWALPKTREYIAELKKRFPEIHIAVVSHGNEQFALQSKHAKNYKKVHSITQQLVAENIPVHVCGTYASWRNISEEDFPEYVDVAAAGPATINDYIALGYILIKF